MVILDCWTVDWLRTIWTLTHTFGWTVDNVVVDTIGFY